MKPVIFLAGVCLLAGVTTVSVAGGRYTNPPAGLKETFDFCTKGLEAAKASNKDVALENAKQARKISLDSYKEISTMPMEIASSSMKKALAAIKEDKLADSIPEFEHCTAKLQDEIDYYKKEGKM